MKAYFLRGGRYLRYDLDIDAVDAGYPKPITRGWSGLVGTGFEADVDSALDPGTGKVAWFQSNRFLRLDQRRNAVDGRVLATRDGWRGFAEAGFADRVDASVNWGNGKAYFFRGDSYLRYDLGAGRVDDGFPLPIAGQWPGLAEAGFATGLDAAMSRGDKAYFFQGDRYLRYDVAADTTDPGYPLPIAGHWPGFDEAGFTRGVDAAWVKLLPGAP